MRRNPRVDGENGGEGFRRYGIGGYDVRQYRVWDRLVPAKTNLSGLGKQGHFDATGLTPSMGAVAQVPAPSPGKGVSRVLLPENRFPVGLVKKNV